MGHAPHGAPSTTVGEAERGGVGSPLSLGQRPGGHAGPKWTTSSAPRLRPLADDVVVAVNENLKKFIAEHYTSTMLNANSVTAAFRRGQQAARHSERARNVRNRFYGGPSATTMTASATTCTHNRATAPTPYAIAGTRPHFLYLWLQFASPSRQPVLPVAVRQPASVRRRVYDEPGGPVATSHPLT